MKMLCILCTILALPLYADALTYHALRNELDGSLINEDDKNIVILVHGWTAKDTIPNGYNRYEDASDAPELNYLVNVIKLKLQNSGKALVTYHWEEDATTGDIWGLPGSDFFGYGDATEAAVNASLHGTHLGDEINNVSTNLRTVHFIAHSAGSWVAREAVKRLLELNPYVVVQLTLLDPFIPDASIDVTTGLSTQRMSESDDLTGSERIYRLENYYSDDRLVWLCLRGPTLSTQETFSWRSGRDFNQEVDWGIIPGVSCYIYYTTHSGPIEFYADTVMATIPGENIPSGLWGTSCPFEFTQVGWYRSIAYEWFLLPRIQSQPQSQTAQIGSTVTLGVTVSGKGPFTYQWYRNGVQLGATDSSHTFELSNSTTGKYVVKVSNANGPVFSDSATIAISSTLPSPSYLSATPVSSSQINLRWTDNAANETGFTIERSLGNGGAWSAIAKRSANVTTYSDLSVVAGTLYSYRVCAYNGTGNSGYSTVASATPLPSGGTTRTLTISSQNPASGVGVNSWVGTSSFQSQVTPASRSFANGTEVGVACPATLPGGLYFQKWKLDGDDYAYDNITSVEMDSSYTLAAVFGSSPPSTKTISSLVVEGPESVTERSSTQFKARASFSDGSEAYVAPEWTDDTSFAHIDDNGVLDTSAVASDKEIEIEASYTAGGVTRSDTKTVLIEDTDPVVTYTLSLYAEHGRINANPDGPVYPAGTEVKLTPSADDHYAMGYWSGDASGTNRSVEITMNRDKSVTHHFQLNTNYGDITCTINPSAANAAGAGWKVYGPDHYNADYKESGETVRFLEPKGHNVVFKDIFGWVKPADMVVPVEGGQDNQVYGTYVEVMGAIQVTIEPQASVEAGALWRVAGSGDWNAGGMCLSDVQPGQYTIEFMNIPGWQVPTSRVVNVSRGRIAATTGTYGPPPGMPIISTIYPATGPLEGGTVLTIEGANFGDGAGVRIGGVAAESINIVSPAMITATVPPRASYGTVPVEVYSGGYTASIANGFSYMNPLGSNIELLGQIGGDVKAVAVISNKLCYGEGPAFVVADVSNSAAPVERGRIALPNTIFHIAIRSNIAYAAAGNAGLYAIDISNPASPAIRGLYDTEGGAYGVAVISNTVYVADNTYGIQIFDASNPAMLQRHAYLPFAGRARRISAGIISGRRYAFVAEDDIATRIVDVTVPSAPVEITNIVARSGDGFTDVKVVGTNLYLTGDSSSGWIYNVSNPSNPLYRTTFPSEGWAYIDVVGTRLYSCSDELIAVSISSTPSQLGRYDVDGSDCAGVCVSNSVAYLAMGPEGVKIVSVSSPSAMTLRSTLSTMPQVNCVWVTNGTALVGSSIGMFTLDVTSPSSPQRAGYLSGPVVDHVVSDNGRATLVDLGSATVRVVNVTNRYSPALIGTYTNLKAYNVASMGSTSVFAGVSRTSGSLPEMDLMRVTAAAPVKVGSLSLASSNGIAAAVALNRNWAYIGQPNVSLDVVNITNPASPVKVGSVALTNHFREVASSTNGDYIYVADWALGIRVVDATNRAAPKLGAVIDPAQTATKGAKCVRVFSNRLYATESDYLFVYDITTPASPQLIAYYDIPNQGYDIYLDGDVLYVANDSDGLTILRMMDIDSPTISITNPTGNATYSTAGAIVNIAGIATDDKGVARVTWDNSRGGGGIAEGTTNWLAADIKLASGNNRVTVTVEDNGGNIGRDTIDISASYEDVIAPAISIALPSPEPEYVASASVIEMSGPVSDNSQFATVNWTNMAGAGGGASVSGEVWIATGVVLRAGPNVIEVMAADGSGNTATDSTVVFYLPVDTNPPTVTVEFPAIDSVCDTRYGAINLSGSAIDDRGVARVEYSINTDTQLVANGTSPWSANGVLLRPGFNAIEVVAYDEAGNSAADTLAVTYIPPPVEMTAASMSNGTIHVHFSGPLGGPYILEASTNMNEWIAIQTNSITGEDPIALPDIDNGIMPKRFYRISGE